MGKGIDLKIQKMMKRMVSYSKTFRIFALTKVLSGLAHVKLMPVGGWCANDFAEERMQK